MQIKERVLLCVGKGATTAEAVGLQIPKTSITEVKKALARLKLMGQITETANGYALTDAGKDWAKRLGCG